MAMVLRPEATVDDLDWRSGPPTSCGQGQPLRDPLVACAKHKPWVNGSWQLERIPPEGMAERSKAAT